MPITVIASHPNQPIPPSLALGGMRILSGVLECLFKGDTTGDVTRDTLNFNVASDIKQHRAGESDGFTYDGAVSNPVWAVDGASVTGFHYSNVEWHRGTLLAAAECALREVVSFDSY